MKRIFPLLLILGLLCACGSKADCETSVPTEQTVPTPAGETTPLQTESLPGEERVPELLPQEFWQDNVLRQDYLEVLGASRSHIRTATFLRSRRDAPEDAVELSAGSGSVLGWIRDGEHLFIAADSGINGAESAMGLFEGCVSLESVTFGEAYRTDLAQSMERMFFGCKSLVSADTGRLVTTSVTDMGEVFYGCMSLQQPEVALWDTASVTNMSGLFALCMSLEAPDVGCWNVEKVQTMDRLFEGCTALRQLELSGWNLKSVRSMEAMFQDCTALLSIGSFPFDHPAVDETTFRGCGVLTR